MEKILNEKTNTQLKERTEINVIQENQTINCVEENITKKDQLKNKQYITNIGKVR